MERVRNQGASLRTLALLWALSILEAGAGYQAAFGQESDEKAIPKNREPTAGSNAAQAIMAAQAPLLAAAERIKKLAPNGTGLGGIRLQLDKHTLEVWWKGDPSAEVREEIARQERDHGIKVVMRSAQRSQRELIETARSVMSKATEYQSVDGSGLEIGVTDTGALHPSSSRSPSMSSCVRSLSSSAVAGALTHLRGGRGP